MQQIILLIHVIVAILIIVLVMMQQGKGSGMGAGFGSGSSGTVFGSQGSLPFLLKLTIFCATVFFATSLGLAVLVARSPRVAQPSVMNIKNSSNLPLSTGSGEQQK
jgi:preprotein translocase subunit SecG